jgi:cephalosporin-C deacetylase-like acetyl esterase
MRREDVEFSSDGTTVRGWLYRPDVDASTEKVPAVALAGGWCYVRELVMPYYAEAFASLGIAALVFDYRNLGVSDGEPRQHLDPWAQIRDYQNALSFLERADGIDPDRLGAWGISYSGGHVLVLAATDPRVKAIVSQIPVVDGYRNMRRVHGGLGYRKLWDAVLEDRRLRYEDPAKRLYIPHASETPDTELSSWPFPETRTTFAALQATEAPLYENRSTMESVDLLLNYDVTPFVDRIYDTPAMVIVAEGDDITLWDLEIGVYNRLPTAKKELVVLPHTTHMTLYSDRSKLDQAAAHASRWFAAQLLGTTARTPG